MDPRPGWQISCSPWSLRSDQCLVLHHVTPHDSASVNSLHTVLHGCDKRLAVFVCSFRVTGRLILCGFSFCHTARKTLICTLQTCCDAWKTAKNPFHAHGLRSAVRSASCGSVPVPAENRSRRLTHTAQQNNHHCSCSMKKKWRILLYTQNLAFFQNRTIYWA